MHDASLRPNRSCSGLSLFAALVLGASGGTVRADSLTNGLIAYYPFNGDAVDATGNGNNGTVAGAVAAPDRFGATSGAFAFLGNAQSRVTFASAALLLQPPFTCSFWVSFSGGAQDPRIFSEWGWEIGTIGTGVSRPVDFDNNTGSGIYDCVSSNAYPDGMWHQIVAVRSTNSMVLYVDGQLQGTLPVSDPIVYSSGFGSVWLPTAGGDAGIGDPYDAFGGSVDDLRFYNRALASGEVASLYVQELGMNLTVSRIPALGLDFKTVGGRNYQLQFSTDLNFWTNEDAVIQGDGTVWSKGELFGSSNAFWRLQTVP